MTRNIKSTYDAEFDPIFEEIFARETKLDSSARLRKNEYRDFYFKLWQRRDYYKLLDEKIDAYEKRPISQRRFIMQEDSEGYFNKADNPYYIEDVKPVNNNVKPQTNYCPYCGERLQSGFTFCPACGKQLKH